MSCASIRRFAERLFRKKNLEEVTSLETPLKRCLTTWHMVFYGISQMAGAGIYVLVGTVIKDEAGPAAVFSFALCALASLFTGLCYVEFSTLVPRAGSCYTFTYITMGELPAFVIGWTMLSDLLLAVASVAKAFSSTVDAVTNRAITNYTLAHMPLPSSTFLDIGPDWIAFSLILVVAVVTATGAAMSMTVNAVLTVTQLVVLTLITVSCFAFGSAANWTNFTPYGIGGVLKGATIAVFAFSGFEALANAAEECENPRRSMPISLLASLGVITLLYLGACLGLSYLVYHKAVDIGSPFVVGFAHSRAPWLQYVAAAGTLLATGATKFSTVYVIPRLFYALAADQVIFSCFAQVNPRLGVPLAGLFVGAAVSALAALLISVETLASLYSLGTLLSYLAIGVDLYLLRYLRSSSELVPRSWAPHFACCSSSLVVKTALATFVLGSLVLGLVVMHVSPISAWWSWLILALSAVPPAVSGALLFAFHPARVPGAAYESPLMPMAPVVAMLVNAVLLASLNPLTWLRFLVWTTLGILIYALYGFQHSKVGSHSEDYMPLTETGGKSEEETRLK